MKGGAGCGSFGFSGLGLRGRILEAKSGLAGLAGLRLFAQRPQRQSIKYRFFYLFDAERSIEKKGFD